MAKPFRGVINVDVTQSVPDWEPYTQPIAPEGTPSVLYIVLDDVGYSAMGPYGGLIETPNIDRIAQRGLTYTNFLTGGTIKRAAVDVSGAPFVDWPPRRAWPSCATEGRPP